MHSRSINIRQDNSRSRWHRYTIGLLTAISCLALVPDVVAQGYPAKAIRFIVPFPPGGGNDILARELGQNVSEPLGVPVVIDNKPGASTIIGTELAAKAPPDGYTIFMGNNSTFTINPNLYQKLPYDPVKDFSPVSLLATAPFLILAHPSVPVRSVKDLIALAKARPRQLNFGSAGIGIVTHLAGEMLNSMARIEMVHVPYKGAGPVLTDLIGGHIELAFINVLSSIPHVRSGRLRGLAVTSAKRNDVLPDLPTVAESGLPGYESSVWYAVLVPARTPQDVIVRLNTEFVKAIRNPKVRDRLTADGASLIGSQPEALAKVIQSDLARWSRVIKDAKLQLDFPRQ